MAGGKFSAQVSAWVAKTKARSLAVRNESVQRIIAIAQTPVGKGGNLPIDTGFLRASGRATKDGSLPPKLDSPPEGSTVSYDEGAISLVIANAALDDVIIFAYTANYARRMEYGFVGRDSLGREFNQKGYRFVGLAAQQWPRVVSEVAAEAKARAGG